MVVEHQYQDLSSLVGSVITVKHTGINKAGQMTNPIFWRERKDISWKEIKVTDENERCGLWEKEENHTEFFKWLGVQLGNDSMEDWYSVTVEEIYQYGGRAVLNNYHNSRLKALQSVYPEHKWLPWKFGHTPSATKS